MHVTAAVRELEEIGCFRLSYAGITWEYISHHTWEIDDELGYKMMWAAANDRRNITISYLIFKRTCQTILQAHQNEQVMATTIRLTSNV